MTLFLLVLLGGPVKTEHVEAQLIAKHATARPGEIARVGLHLNMDPGWHVYWRNAGDAGDRVYLTFAKPLAVDIGAFLWPGPHRIPMPGEIMNFGYEGELLLPFDITVPKDHPDGEIRLRAVAEWLVCDDNGCIPDRVNLEIVLTVSKDAPQANARHAAVFRASEALLPRAAPDGALRATAGGDGVTLTMDLDGKEFVFFPYAAEDIVHFAPQLVHDGALALTTQRDLSRLHGVLVVDHARVYEVDLPVGADAGSNTLLYVAIGGILVVAVLFVRRRKR